MRAKKIVEQAISLERELWSGEPSGSEGMPGASEIASQIEGLLRTILRRGVTGEIGTDFRAAADEALLADGLAFGEGSPTELGTDTEWDFDAIEIDSVTSEEEPLTADSDSLELDLDLGFDHDDEEIVVSRRTDGVTAAEGAWDTDAEITADSGVRPEQTAEEAGAATPASAGARTPTRG